MDDGPQSVHCKSCEGWTSSQPTISEYSLNAYFDLLVKLGYYAGSAIEGRVLRKEDVPTGLGVQAAKPNRKRKSAGEGDAVQTADTAVQKR